jgi:hypothetical protein
MKARELYELVMDKKLMIADTGGLLLGDVKVVIYMSPRGFYELIDDQDSNRYMTGYLDRGKPYEFMGCDLFVADHYHCDAKVYEA